MFVDLKERDFNDVWNGCVSLPESPECKLGDELVFRVNERPAARAIVSRIEKFEGYRVYWQNHTFEEIST